ncbi:MAG: type I methionyl aminopeptidase, partial [Patescibacteria group bacterium]
MVSIKSLEEIQIMQAGGKILAEILRTLEQSVKAGIRTQELENLTRQLLNDYPGAQPTFLGYDGYPAALCVSINEEVVHGLPSERIIQPGDLVSIDFGVQYRGLITDSATTILVNSDDLTSSQDVKLKKKLLQVTRECLNLAIAQARPGKTIGDIGFAIQSHAEKNGFAVVRQLVGHGVGRGLHEEPEVPNFGQRGGGQKLEAGMILAIEPMLVAGKPEVIE